MSADRFDPKDTMITETHSIHTFFANLGQQSLTFINFPLTIHNLLAKFVDFNMSVLELYVTNRHQFATSNREHS